MYLNSVLVERYTAALADLRYVRMLVRRAHLKKHAYQISYFEWIATMNHLSFVDYRAIGALVSHAFVPTKREGMIEVVGADSHSNARGKSRLFVLLLLLSEDILDIEGSLEYGPLEVSRRVPKSATDPVEVVNDHICRSFYDFL